MNARDVLNELKWHHKKDLSSAMIFYVHRGAPDDRRIISGSEIIELASSFFHTGDASIPYHRVFRIDHDGRTIFERAR